MTVDRRSFLRGMAVVAATPFVMKVENLAHDVELSPDPEPSPRTGAVSVRFGTPSTRDGTLVVLRNGKPAARMKLPEQTEWARLEGVGVERGDRLALEWDTAAENIVVEIAYSEGGARQVKVYTIPGRVSSGRSTETPA